VILATSSDKKEIMEAAGGKKAPILVEIRRIEQELVDDYNVQPVQHVPAVGVLDNMLVRKLAVILVRLREQLFKFKDPISEIKQVRQRGITSSVTMFESRSLQMNTVFYQLEESIVSDFSDPVKFDSLQRTVG
jgi:hypothetical protein